MTEVKLHSGRLFIPEQLTVTGQVRSDRGTLVGITPARAIRPQEIRRAPIRIGRRMHAGRTTQPGVRFISAPTRESSFKPLKVSLRRGRIDSKFNPYFTLYGKRRIVDRQLGNRPALKPCDQKGVGTKPADLLETGVHRGKGRGSRIRPAEKKKKKGEITKRAKVRTIHFREKWSVEPQNARVPVSIKERTEDDAETDKIKRNIESTAEVDHRGGRYRKRSSQEIRRLPWKHGSARSLFNESETRVGEERTDDQVRIRWQCN